MLEFYDKELFEIEEILKEQLEIIDENSILEFSILNPDNYEHIYSGEKVSIDNKVCIYRSYKCWSDLANILKCKFLTPITLNEYFVKIRLKPLKKQNSFHKSEECDKYGATSLFNKLEKNEEISFLHYYKQALENVYLDKRLRILNIGVNKASEFDVIKKLSKDFSSHELVGIDISNSAIELAKQKFINDKNVEFYCEDVLNLDSLNLGKFDLIISIGTLQSSNFDTHTLFRELFQKFLNNDGAIIIAMPNCRWVDGELIYGANVKNYNFSEMGLVYKDISYFKKYLQQKNFRVMITGREYIFLSATSFK